MRRLSPVRIIQGVDEVFQVPISSEVKKARYFVHNTARSIGSREIMNPLDVPIGETQGIDQTVNAKVSI